MKIVCDSCTNHDHYLTIGRAGKDGWFVKKYKDYLGNWHIDKKCPDCIKKERKAELRKEDDRMEAKRLRHEQEVSYWRKQANDSEALLLKIEEIYDIDLEKIAKGCV